MIGDVPLIGLAGTNGSGKDAIGLLLARKYNFLFISVTDLLRAELHKRGLPIERHYMRQLSSEWRREHGLSVLIDEAVATFQADKHNYAGLVLASLRNPYEADRVHELGGTVLWVDAEPQVRYERLKTAKRQGREGDDDKTFEEFMAEEAIEMQPGDDETSLNMGAVKERADLTVLNNTSDMNVLEADVEHTLGLE